MIPLLNIFKPLIFSGKSQLAVTNGNGIIYSKYFPLEVGNEWVYEKSIQDTDLFTVRVVEKVIFNNNEYYKVISFNSITESRTIEYLRNNAGKIYSYCNKKEVMKYDLTGTEFSNNRKFHIMFHVQETIPLGEFYDCIYIWNNFKSILESKFLFFAPGIGIIEYKIIDTSFSLILKHATINGKQLF